MSEEKNKGIKTIEFQDEIYVNVEDVIDNIAVLQNKHKNKPQVVSILEVVMASLDKLQNTEEGENNGTNESGS